MNNNVYGILCIKGSTRSWLKRNGEIVTYETIGKAQIEVDRIRAKCGRIYNIMDYFAEDVSDILYRVIYIKHNDVTLLTCKETLEEAIAVAKEYRKEYSVGFIIVEKGKGDEAKIFYGH